MYQVPVQKPDHLRSSRRRVKKILGDIGLDSCRRLLHLLQLELSGGDTEKESLQTTDWGELTDGYSGTKKKRKWCYRTQPLCCSLCFFSTCSWSSYHSHIHKYHEEEKKEVSLAPCSLCSFVSKPSLLGRHERLFHPHKAPQPHQNLSKGRKTLSPVKRSSQVGALAMHPGSGGDRFSCSSCGFHDNLLYVMRKHILVNHCEALLKRYFGHLSDGSSPMSSGRFFCRVCELPSETWEHLLYHLLSSDKHKDLNRHISPLLVEHCNFSSKGTSNARIPQLPPNTMDQVVSLVSKTTVAPPSSTQKPLPPTGTVMLAPHSQTTALICSAGRQQILLANQNPVAMATSPDPRAAGAVRLLLSTQPQPLPLSLGMSSPVQATPRQVLLPPAVTFNLGGARQPLVLTTTGGRMEVSTSQTLMMTQQVPVQAPPPRMSVIPRQSTVQLVPTGNQVNGLPTYTLTTVQLAVPVQSAIATATLNKPPIVVTVPPQTNQSQLVAQQSAAIPTNQKPKSDLGAGHTKELAARSQYLVWAGLGAGSGALRCSRCRVLLSDKGIFQHLLHGLQCLFCPLLFYSLKQLLCHSEAEHSLRLAANQERARSEHGLSLTTSGGLLIPEMHISTTVPRNLLGCKKLQLALVTQGHAQQVMYVQLSEEQTPPPSPSLPPASCPFCPAQSLSSAAYELHLRQRHHILPTVHAILKTPAFKCVYCLGVYTESFTTATISVHVQRCRCAPRSAKQAERLQNHDTHSLNGTRVRGSFSSWGRGHAPMCRDPVVTFALEPPAGLDLQPPEQKKHFLVQYFNKKPYPTIKEIEVLGVRLCLDMEDVSSFFASTQQSCIEACERPISILLEKLTTTHTHTPGRESVLVSQAHNDHLYADPRRAL